MSFNSFSLFTDLIGAFKAILDTLGPYADFIGIGTAVISLVTSIKVRNFQKHEKKRLDQKIKIKLIHKEGDLVQAFIDVPGKMRREDFTRGEILGWIGMLPMIDELKGKRYEIKSLSSEDFLERMNEIKAGIGDKTLEVFCEKCELEQFKVVPQKPEQVETPQA